MGANGWIEETRRLSSGFALIAELEMGTALRPGSTEDVAAAEEPRVGVAVRLAGEDCIGRGAEKRVGGARPSLEIVVGEAELVLVDDQHVYCGM